MPTNPLSSPFPNLASITAQWFLGGCQALGKLQRACQKLICLEKASQGAYPGIKAVDRHPPAGLSQRRPAILHWPISRQQLLIGLACACLSALPLSQRQLPQLSSAAGSMGIQAGRPGAEGGDPVQFSAVELQELQRRFGVHGPQPRLTQLLSEGIDQLQPLRSNALARIEELRPIIRQESARSQVNPVFVAAVLFDEMRHAKPGEDLPIAARSGLFSTHGPAQLGVGELIHQGLLAADASPEQLAAARELLLDPYTNVRVLVGKFARLSRDLGLPQGRMLQASRSPRDAKGIATLAYLHNGKLDYPRRILRSMNDPELHAVLFGDRKQPITPLI